MPNPFEVDVDVEAGAATPASQAGDYFGDGRNSTPHRDKQELRLTWGQLVRSDLGEVAVQLRLDYATYRRVF